MDPARWHRKTERDVMNYYCACIFGAAPKPWLHVTVRKNLHAPAYYGKPLRVSASVPRRHIPDDGQAIPRCCCSNCRNSGSEILMNKKQCGGHFIFFSSRHPHALRFIVVARSVKRPPGDPVLRRPLKTMIPRRIL